VGTNLVASIPALGGVLHVVVTGSSSLGTGSAVLLRFYTWHIFGLTLLFIVVGIWHVFRVRRDGGIAVPPPQQRQDKTRISRNELVRREALAMTLTATALVILSVARPAPISPGIVSLDAATAEARAPWFFLWVQQLLAWGDPFMMGILVPTALLAVLASIPYVLPLAAGKDLGEWLPRSNRAAQILFCVVAALVGLLTALALLGKG
jgi:quinol-cytochrome oxidoreductase complex cytochrome b subunit